MVRYLALAQFVKQEIAEETVVKYACAACLKDVYSTEVIKKEWSTRSEYHALQDLRSASSLRQHFLTEPCFRSDLRSLLLQTLRSGFVPVLRKGSCRCKRFCFGS